MKIMFVTGARPNLIKASALYPALVASGVDVQLVHTGQHSDDRMYGVFKEQLGLPSPRYDLGMDITDRLEMIARCSAELHMVFERERPTMVIVVGDVNSTLAGALAAKKLDFPLAHVEAGLRSFDLSMPEEINRTATDAMSDLLFATEPSAVRNLEREGKPPRAIHFVGNVLIDSLQRFLPVARLERTAAGLDLRPGEFGILTMHRPDNVDTLESLEMVKNNIDLCDCEFPIVFPVHPRTHASMKATGILREFKALRRMRLLEPMGYVEFLSLLNDSRFVITDSGGIQEESTVLGIPCLTLRDNTERPVTIEQGTNKLVGARGETLAETLKGVLSCKDHQHCLPELWDGQAAQRIAKVLLDTLGGAGLC